MRSDLSCRQLLSIDQLRQGKSDGRSAFGRILYLSEGSSYSRFSGTEMDSF
jgi:hypothetical protein